MTNRTRLGTAMRCVPHPGRPRRQRGATAVEVAMLALIFFTIIFGTLEIARTIYVFNTLQEVTRRAASELVRRAPADPNSAGIVEVKRRAIFQDAGDELFFAAPITVNHVRVEYQSLRRESDGSLTRTQTSSLPACADENRRICMTNPNDPGCVRFVRVRICEPGNLATCDSVRYQTVFPLAPLNLSLPLSTTIATVETLGADTTPTVDCM